MIEIKGFIEFNIINYQIFHMNEIVDFVLSCLEILSLF